LPPPINFRGSGGPISAGYQIQHLEYTYTFSCTLGWNVNVSGAGAPGKGFLTAGHCNTSTPGDGVTGGLQYQATLFVQNQVGYVHTNPPWNRTDPECAQVALCTIADAIYVKYDVPSNAMPRSVKTDYVGVNNAVGSLEANFYLEPLYAVMEPYVGLTLDKIGRTSGWTRGTVTATCSNTVSGGKFANSIPYTSVVLCHDEFSNAAGGPGDSGGPVFYKTTGNGIFYVGVLYARGGFVPPGSETGICTASCVIAFTRWYRIKEHLNMWSMSPVF
jgi:hypothetical protein